MSDERYEQFREEIFWSYFWPLFGMSFAVFLVVYVGLLLMLKLKRSESE